MVSVPSMDYNSFINNNPNSELKIDMQEGAYFGLKIRKRKPEWNAIPLRRGKHPKPSNVRYKNVRTTVLIHSHEQVETMKNDTSETLTNILRFNLQ